MLYLAIDQHSKQLTVNLRDEEGRVLLRRQVSTRWEKVQAFFDGVRSMAVEHGGWMAILEVCGFNDWLLKMLSSYECSDIVLIQPTKRSKNKTDRRDADKLGELLWVNRRRLRDQESVQGVRRVRILGEWYQQCRRLTTLHLRITGQRTRTINQIKQILRRHNLQHQQPTKGIQTRAAEKWLRTLELPYLDRLALNQLLTRWTMWEEQLSALADEIRKHCEMCKASQLIGTITGRAGFSSLALVCRIGPIEDFPSSRSLANFWGLVPSCQNSGEATRRLGAITKEGSSVARYVLGQLVLHVLKRDPKMRAWHRRIKLRRGSKIARVAVMRRLAVIIWHMLKNQQPYRPNDGVRPPSAALV